MNQNNLLEKYKQQIEEISSKELNSDQKKFSNSNFRKIWTK